MKKFVPTLSIVLFPYAVAFVLYCIFSGFLMENIFQNNAYTFLFLYLELYVCLQFLHLRFPLF